MTDLDQNSNQSPRRKFSFRFPNLSSNHDKDNPGAQMMSGTSTLTHQNNSSKERRNFSEDVKNVPDLQVSLHFNNFLHFLELLKSSLFYIILIASIIGG